MHSGPAKTSAYVTCLLLNSYTIFYMGIWLNFWDFKIAISREPSNVWTSFKLHFSSFNKLFQVSLFPRYSDFVYLFIYSFLCCAYPDTGDQCSQLIVATLVPSTPICLFFNLAKLQCKQTVVTDFCIGFVNKIHIIGKGMIKQTWIAKIKEIRCWTEELITFCPFSPVSMWSKRLPDFAVKHVDLRLLAWRAMLGLTHRRKQYYGWGLDTRPSSLYWQIEPGVFLA